MSTPIIPGVDREVLADVIREGTYPLSWDKADAAADAVLAYIAAHQECACDREHADDEWVEADKGTWDGQPEGARRRMEWVRGDPGSARLFVHRDDLPDPDAAKVERMAKAIFASDIPDSKWETHTEGFRENYRRGARAALAASREEERGGSGEPRRS